jgi:hypothetical protein
MRSVFIRWEKVWVVHNKRSEFRETETKNLSRVKWQIPSKSRHKTSRNAIHVPVFSPFEDPTPRWWSATRQQFPYLSPDYSPTPVSLTNGISRPPRFALRYRWKRELFLHNICLLPMSQRELRSPGNSVGEENRSRRVTGKSWVGSSSFCLFRNVASLAGLGWGWR